MLNYNRIDKIFTHYYLKKETREKNLVHELFTSFKEKLYKHLLN